MEFVRFHAMKTSIDLARTRGAFPAIKGSIYDPVDLKWAPPQPLEPFTFSWGRPSIDWKEIVAGIEKYGIRNAAQTTIAPTGTIATVAGDESYGCEPVFALAYTRHVNDNGRDLTLDYVSPMFEQALRRAGVDETTQHKIFETVRLTGTCQDVSLVPEAIRNVFVVAGDITPEEHVRMQAAMQAFVDNSLSKTINFPETATIEEVGKAYFLAWKLGCKGITVYIAGTREQVVLETKEIAQKRAKTSSTSPEYVVAQKKPRSHALQGQTYKIETPLGTAYVTVNRNGDNEPFEVFCNVGKAGSDTAAVSEAIGRLASLALRMPSPLSPTERLEEVVNQLAGIGGGRPMGFGLQRVRSLPDGIAQVLSEDLGQPRAEHSQELESKQLHLFQVGDLCPECGQAAFVAEEGCRRCYSCGHSEC
jgi:ribonucleoside-diphosphate reductase alpha chain